MADNTADIVGIGVDVAFDGQVFDNGCECFTEETGSSAVGLISDVQSFDRVAIPIESSIE